MAIVLLPGLSSLGSPYGMLLIAKALVFAGLMGLAGLNKFRLGPAVASGHEPSLALLRRCVAIEVWLIVVVLTATAVMTTLYSPESRGASPGSTALSSPSRATPLPREKIQFAMRGGVVPSTNQNVVLACMLPSRSRARRICAQVK